VQIFEAMAKKEHDQLVFWSDVASGYRGIIAIHDTTLGPALGGTRFWNYASEAEAITDVLRLARGMTYKAAITGLALGGGKSVIIGDNHTTEREAIFRAHGRAVESLGGRYITAADVGTSVDDMEYLRKETQWVTGVRGRSGSPAPATAFGVCQGLKACARFRYGEESLEGRHVVVQGLGHVGYRLCKHLAEEGARLTVADIEDERVQKAVADFGATAVAPDDVYGIDADIFSPCALGAVINDDTLDRLKVDIVAGSANNQLAETRHGKALHERGIVYAPDYVINAGGICSVYGELEGWTAEQSMEKAGGIYECLLQVLGHALIEDIPTSRAADNMARRRIVEARRVRDV
jgi:leucine dehydrogenase